MLRWFRFAALALGAPLLLVLVLGCLLLVGRYAQVQWLQGAPAAPHLAQKQAYLAAIPTRAAASAPNVVIVLFDDLGFGDLSGYGNSLIETPQLDKAAEEGLRFSSFYAASPVCTPSRAALLTGRYPPRTRTDRHVFFPEESWMAPARRMMGWANELPEDEITLAEVLGKAGYATGMIGKWHLGGREGHRPTDFGFDSWFGVLWSNDMVPLHLYRDQEILEQDDRAPGPLGSGERDEAQPLGPGGVDQSRLTERYTKEAIAFLEENREGPFFLYLAHTFPHVPHYPSTVQAGRSAGGRYGDVIEDLDRSTGAILAALDRLNLAEDTLVLITSDNGADYNGSPGALRGRKGETYEGGQRVPMVAQWPSRVAAGSATDVPAILVDVFPTVLALAGLPLPSDRVVDGRDLTALLAGEEATAEAPLFYFPVLDSLPEAVRVGPYKYLLRTGDPGRDRGHLSRVDADAENHELSSLFPERADKLARVLEEMRSRVEENPRGWR